MVFASGSQSQLSYIKETTWGQTPTATPQMTKVEFVSESLKLKRDNLSSNMIKADRNITYFNQGNNASEGSLKGEMVYRMFDDFLSSALFSDWSANILKNGSNQRSLTIERGLNDIGQYFLYPGMLAGGFNLKVAPNRIVSMDFNLSGKGEQVNASDWAGANGGGYVDNSALLGKTPMDSFTGQILENGLPIATITELEINLENNLSDLFVIGSQDKTAISEGRCVVTGSISFYVENANLYQKFVQGDESSLVLSLEEANSGLVSNNSYNITLPRIRYTGGEASVSGEGEIIARMPFQALYDATEACSIMIERIDKSDV